MRLAQAAEEIESGHRVAGPDGAREFVRRRAGKAIDPRIATLFLGKASEVCGVLEVASAWTAAMEIEPGAPRVASNDEVDEVLRAMAHFADLKSRFTHAHSTGVSALARRAAAHMRLGADEERRVEQAALVHDLGRVAVTAAIWDKPGSLTDVERERVRTHTYLGERILSSSPSLSAVAEIATLAHERLDGSGYHRRLSGASSTVPARILAAADAFHAMTEERPHRRALRPEAAAESLSGMARSGLLCADATRSVLAASGQPVPTRRADPSGLTEREVEVLRLVARGSTNKEVAVALGISAKTAGHHVQHIFEKIGVTTRAAATLFAMQKGVVT
jgi:HD-GYP domain-containing protein (c-di-GMP phosphodiesterase class II)/DNA-binding CsgD family transcriptional regulator